MDETEIAEVFKRHNNPPTAILNSPHAAKMLA